MLGRARGGILGKMAPHISGVFAAASLEWVAAPSRPPAPVDAVPVVHPNDNRVRRAMVVR